jgi:MOSC domain-containing protein YiiM
VTVSSSAEHSFHKTPCETIALVAGHGVEGDAHAGETVQHRSRVAVDPSQPNLRQVHLIHEELFDDLRSAGFDVLPGQLGENITTIGLSLLALPQRTHLRIGEEALLEVTGLRNPCAQLDNFKPGLTKSLVHLDASGNVIRKAGVMAIVINGGRVRCGDTIEVLLPSTPHQPLERV